MVAVLVQNTCMIYNIMQNRNVWIEWLWSQVSISFSEPCLNSQGLNPGRRRLWQVVHHLWTAASTSNLSSLLIQPSTDRNISLCSWREERLYSLFTTQCQLVSIAPDRMWPSPSSHRHRTAWTSHFNLGQHCCMLARKMGQRPSTLQPCPLAGDPSASLLND